MSNEIEGLFLSFLSNVRQVEKEPQRQQWQQQQQQSSYIYM